MLKSNKNKENLARYKDIIAQIKVKIVREEDNLKKELKNLELIFLKDSNNTTIQPYCSCSNGDKTLNDSIIQKLQLNSKTTKLSPFLFHQFLRYFRQFPPQSRNPLLP